jgi:hypothetical protein
VSPEISAEPASVDFGDTAPGVLVERTVTLRNTREAGLTLSEVGLEGIDASRFLLGSLETLQVEGGGWIAVRVVYAPAAPGRQ